MAASVVLSSVPSHIENFDSHVILLKSLTDAGEVEMAIEHIKWIRNNCGFKLQKTLSELIASLSTTPNFESVLKLLQGMHAEGLLFDDGPWMNLLGDHYA